MSNKFIIEVRSKGFKNTERQLDKVTHKTKEYTKANKDLRGRTQGLTRAIGKMRNDMLLLSFSFGAVIIGIKKFVDAAAGFEAVKARLVGLTGSVEGAEKAFNAFNEVAASTPFQLQDVVDAGAQLQAFGVNAQEMIKPVTDLAAFMGTTATEAANALGRAFAGGAGAADILRERGILNLIKTSQGLDDSSKTTLPQFRDALIRTIQDPTTGIAGSTDRMSETFVGATSNMMDAITRLSAAIGEHMLPVMKDMTDSIKFTAEFLERNVKSTVENATAFDELTRAIEFNEGKLDKWRKKLEEANQITMQSGESLQFVNLEVTNATRMIEHLESTIDSLMNKFIAEELAIQNVNLRMAEGVPLAQLYDEMFQKVEKNTSSLADPFQQTIRFANLLGEAIESAFVPGQTAGEHLRGVIISFLGLIQQAVLASKLLSETLTFTFSGPLGIAKAIGALIALEGLKTAVRNVEFAETGYDGVVSQPTLFVAGEGNKAERVSVTPLQGPNINGPQGSGITINISAPLVDETVVDHIIPAIQKAQRLNLA